MGQGSQTMQSQAQGAGVLRLEARGLGQGMRPRLEAKSRLGVRLRKNILSLHIIIL